MIIGYEGGLGSGKTLGMVRNLVKDHSNGNRVYANFGLRKIDYDYVNVMDIMQDPDLNNVSIGIDEFTVFFDCRKSSSKMNRLLSYFILQTRKRNVNLYFTTQSFGMVDLRLMNHCNIQIVCEMVYKNNKPIEHTRKYTIYDCRNLKSIKITTYYLNISKYYDFYDTNEVILPPI